MAPRLHAVSFRALIMAAAWVVGARPAYACLVTPTAEVCDGCDNDCDGVTDDGVESPVPCGPVGPGEPAYCMGTQSCKPPQAVPPGGCTVGGGWTACNNNPQPEVCNALDDDCNAVIDDGVPVVDCVLTGAPPNLVYGGNSACKKGKTTCVSGITQCGGFVGPSSEVCDGIDNDCDGTTDEGAPGVGQACGNNVPPCQAGTTACVNGTLVCTGGVMPQPEVCDGIDNDCNGVADNGPLTDGPATGSSGCWKDSGTCCGFPAFNPTLQWCPPAGATCSGIGTLPAPCSAGTLTCTSGAWTCSSPKPPAAETCDGADNDCDGALDDGVPSGGACTMPYDTNLYPGSRTSGACKAGVSQCNATLGAMACAGGVAPSPELCDGIDNDCDGLVDEAGLAPDGVDGSANPNAPPAAKIGESCGTAQGECAPGVYICAGAVFACSAAGPTSETCNCLDDDCDGVVDNANADGGAPLCATGEDCVQPSAGSCGCAAACDPQDPTSCPTGHDCVAVQSSETGQTLGPHCVPSDADGGLPDAGEPDSGELDAASDGADATIDGAELEDAAGHDGSTDGAASDAGDSGGGAQATGDDSSGCACRLGRRSDAQRFALLGTLVVLFLATRRRAARRHQRAQKRHLKSLREPRSGSG